MSHSLDALHEQRKRLLEQLSALEPFRPGSLVGRYRKCGNPRCHCAKPADRGHGPSWSLTRTVKGKTVTKIVQPDSVPAVRAQIEGHRAMQKLLRRWVEVNVSICDALVDGEADGPERAEKGGSTPK